NIQKIKDEVRSIFMNYSWPGNIRELENVMERSILLSETTIITVNELPPNIVKGSYSPTAKAVTEKPHTMKDAVKKQTQMVERSMITAILKETNGNITKAAKKLGISRKSLQTKMKDYELRKD
ncbi:helix-turn-helix domain-containing protein, partial [candidate division CSSED10-310 bacterium]